jgi:hypothetical protein
MGGIGGGYGGDQGGWDPGYGGDYQDPYQGNTGYYGQGFGGGGQYGSGGGGSSLMDWWQQMQGGGQYNGDPERGPVGWNSGQPVYATTPQKQPNQPVSLPDGSQQTPGGYQGNGPTGGAGGMGQNTYIQGGGQRRFDGGPDYLRQAFDQYRMPRETYGQGGSGGGSYDPTGRGEQGRGFTGQERPRDPIADPRWAQGFGGGRDQGPRDPRWQAGAGGGESWGGGYQQQRPMRRRRFMGTSNAMPVAQGQPAQAQQAEGPAPNPYARRA